MLVDVLVDLHTRFQNNVPEVPSSSLGTPIGLPPSPFSERPERFQDVPFSCERASSWRSRVLFWSTEVPGRASLFRNCVGGNISFVWVECWYAWI